MSQYYCTRCGDTKAGEKQCLCCLSHNTLPIPEKYLTYIADVVPVFNEELKDEFIEKVVKPNPNFDQTAYERLPEIRAMYKRQNEMLRNETQEQKNVPKCPTCSSTDIQKIGTGERVTSVAILGIFSKKINKSFKCKNCGYTW